jgi:protein required for attachment to host cells
MAANQKGTNGQLWVVVVDGERARLLRGSKANGRPHLDLVGTIENDHLEDKQYGRPTMLRGGAGTSPTLLAPGHQQEERMKRFARDVAAWLHKTRAEHAVATFEVIAPKRLMGALRPEWPKDLEPHVSEHQVELNWMEVGELVKHPVVAGLFPPA